MTAMWNLRIAVGFVWIFVEIFVGRITRLFRLWSSARGRGSLAFTRIIDVFDAFA